MGRFGGESGRVGEGLTGHEEGRGQGDGSVSCSVSGNLLMVIYNRGGWEGGQLPYPKHSPLSVQGAKLQILLWPRQYPKKTPTPLFLIGHIDHTRCPMVDSTVYGFNYCAFTGLILAFRGWG